MSKRLRVQKDDEFEIACLPVPSGRFEEVAADDITVA